LGRIQVKTYENEKPLNLRSSGISLFLFELDYLACAVSTVAVSTVAAVSTTAAVSVAVESAFSAGLLPLPQDAKEIAAKATNIKTNFFIFFAF
jgi:hypothetical protein